MSIRLPYSIPLLRTAGEVVPRGETVPPEGGRVVPLGYVPPPRPWRVPSGPGQAPFRLHDLPPVALDGLLALLVTAVALVSFVGRLEQVLETEHGSVHFNPPDTLGAVLLLCGTVPIAWRRRYPLLVFLVTSGAFFAYFESGYAPPPLPYSLIVVMGTLAAAWTPRRSASAVVAVVIAMLLLYFTHHSPITDDYFVAYLVAILAGWAVGYGIQLSRARAALVEERTIQLARERDTLTRLAVEQERARIARDLHDIVAHHVSVIVAQAGAAQRVLDRRPDEGRRALHSIETTGRQAMVEMRRMLGVLTLAADTEPAPAQHGLGQLASLIEHTQHGGLRTELQVRGIPRILPAAVETSAYRVVQEALTNALRHAGAAQVRVIVDYQDAVLGLRIRDDGRGGAPAGDSTGRGLVGMRQRVTMLGGRLWAGPLPDGGFEVAADIPVPSGAA